MARVYHSGFACGGVAIGDLDGDHRPDLFLVSGPGSNRLFRQEADFQFKDISAQTGIDGGNAWGAGAAMADIDNDGDLDIYVCNHDAPNQLYLNDGDGHFVEAAHSFGIAISDACLMPSFCDFDRDGDLDLFIVTAALRFRRQARAEGFHYGTNAAQSGLALAFFRVAGL